MEEVGDAVRSQLQMLDKRKGSGPLVRSKILQKNATGEAVLDFFVSARDAKDGNGQSVNAETD